MPRVIVPISPRPKPSRSHARAEISTEVRAAELRPSERLAEISAAAKAEAERKAAEEAAAAAAKAEAEREAAARAEAERNAEAARDAPTTDETPEG